MKIDQVFGRCLETSTCLVIRTLPYSTSILVAAKVSMDILKFPTIKGTNCMK